MKRNIATVLVNRLRVFGAASVMLLVGILQSPAALAACSTTTNPPTTYGKVTQAVTVPTAGTYTVWSRIKAPDTTNNSYYLQVDSGTCAYKVGDATSIPANQWTWVNYQNGSTSSTISVSLTAGAHTLIYTGAEPNVELDRVEFVAGTCVPSVLGDNCADTIAPTVSITSPANNATVSPNTTVPITATASDNSGTVTSVEFLIDGTSKLVDTTSPYSYSWSTSGLTAGSTHSITARATDPSGLTATSTISVTIKTGSPTPSPSPSPSPTPSPPPPCTPGDANCDGKVNIFDYSILASHDSSVAPYYAPADFNHDGTVGAADLAILIGHWTG